MSLRFKLQQPTFDAKGNSGDCLELMHLPDYGYVVVKTRVGSGYRRLVNQAKIQTEMYNRQETHLLKTARIFRVECDDHNMTAKVYMEYLRYPSLFTTFALSSPLTIRSIIYKFVSYFESLLVDTQPDSSVASILHDKIDELSEKLNPSYSDFLVYLRKRTNKIAEQTITGSCHGDFTFANLMYSPDDGDLYAIDYLDNPFSSPIFDIVKLRQDTVFFLFLGQDIIPARVSFMSSLVDKHLISMGVYRRFSKDLIDYFDILNLLRLIPYLSSKALVVRVEENLKLIWRGA